MVTTTRREFRLSTASTGGSGSKSPNLEQILDTFDQFKRKHITQNRDIIKTNALAQLRVRELETRIQNLESERCDQARENAKLQAQVQKLVQSLRYVRLGWDLIGKGMWSASSEGDGGSPWPDGLSPRDIMGLHSELSVNGTSEPSAAHMQSGSRISLAHSTLPAGVIRSVARPPEVHISDLVEESEEVYCSDEDSSYGSEVTSEQEDLTARVGNADRIASAITADGAPQQMIETDMDSDETPAPTGRSTKARRVNRVAGRRQASAGIAAQRVSYVEATAGMIDSPRLDAGIPPSPLPTPPIGHQVDTSPLPWLQDLHFPSVEKQVVQSPAPTLEAHVHRGHEEAMPSGLAGSVVEPSVDEAERRLQLPKPRDAPRPRRSSRRASIVAQHRLNEGTIPFGEAAESEEEPLVSSSPRRRRPEKPADVVREKRGKRQSEPVLRKRKLAAQSPERELTSSLCESATFANENASALTSSEAAAEGRSARRTRATVNYALPKLNTKMRKPDPVDLIPAPQEPCEKVEDPVGSPSSARFVASSGNLSDIRRQHEQQRVENTSFTVESEEREREDEGQHPIAAAVPASNLAHASVESDDEAEEDKDDNMHDLDGPTARRRASLDLHDGSERHRQDEPPASDDDDGSVMIDYDSVLSTSDATDSQSEKEDARMQDVAPRLASADSESGLSSSSRSQCRPALRRRSHTLPARHLTPSKDSEDAAIMADDTGTPVASHQELEGEITPPASEDAPTPTAASFNASTATSRSMQALNSDSPQINSLPKSSTGTGERPVFRRPSKDQLHPAATPSENANKRPHTFSTATAKKMNLNENASASSLGRSFSTSTSNGRERVSLHAALTAGRTASTASSSSRESFAALLPSVGSLSPLLAREAGTGVKRSSNALARKTTVGPPDLGPLAAPVPRDFSVTTLSSASSASSGRTSPAFSVASSADADTQVEVRPAPKASAPARPPLSSSSSGNSLLASTPGRTRVIVRHGPSSTLKSTLGAAVAVSKDRNGSGHSISSSSSSTSSSATITGGGSQTAKIGTTVGGPGHAAAAAAKRVKRAGQA